MTARQDAATGRGPTRQRHLRRDQSLAATGDTVIAISPSFNNTQADMDNFKNVIDQQILEQAADIASVIDWSANHNSELFDGRLDLDRIGVIGHSFGGEISMRAGIDDPRVLAVANLDGAAVGLVQGSYPKPLLVIASDTPGATVQPMPGTPGYYVHIDGVTHNGLATELAQAAHDQPGSPNPASFGAIDPQRASRILADYTTAFFGLYLAGRSTVSFDGPSSDHAEVEVRT